MEEIGKHPYICITQDIKIKQSVGKYSLKHGVTVATLRDKNIFK